MLTLEQFVLCKIAEEATEVGKRALKQQQFGMHQHEEGYAPNGARLTSEATDMSMWFTVAQHLGYMDRRITGVRVYSRWRDKRAEMLRVLKISVAAGEVSPDVLQFIESNDTLPD